MTGNGPNRRAFLGAAAAAGLASRLAGAGESAAVPEQAASPDASKLITPAESFVDVSRGNPKPHTLRGDALVKARLTAESWRLEVEGDGTSQLARTFRLADGSALDMARLQELARAHGVAYLKAMQCNNIATPLGQGLWEGVPLREVVRLVGKMGNVRRVHYSGFHNDDPAQLFRSSLPLNRVLETPPSEPPAIVAFRLNGAPIPLTRGGPARLVVPWAHGFKSIKWLQRIVLTNDYLANDTYALQNNDPESYLKTAAYLPKGPLTFAAGEPVEVEGTAMVGWSGLERVECWIRRAGESTADLADDDPAWSRAEWRPATIPPPPTGWSAILPPGSSTRKIWGFDSKTGQPRQWPLPFSTVPWSMRLEKLEPGAHELRARTVDLNGFAQPEPRPYQKSGQNKIPTVRIEIRA